MHVSFLSRQNFPIWLYLKLTEGILKSTPFPFLDFFYAFPFSSSLPFSLSTFLPEWTKIRGIVCFLSYTFRQFQIQSQFAFSRNQHAWLYTPSRLWLTELLRLNLVLNVINQVFYDILSRPVNVNELLWWLVGCLYNIYWRIRVLDYGELF